jgi:hypothetical protein
MPTGQINSAWRSVIGAALATACVLMVPLAAMQLTDEVAWSPTDFVVAGALLFSAGLAYKLLAGRTGNAAYRAAVGLAVASALVLVWLNLAVGIIGSENNPANLMYGGVLAVGVIGAVFARFRPRGMARVLLAMALAQALVAAIALIGRLGSPGSGPLEILTLNGLFVALFAGSAYLFRRSAGAVE